VSTVLSSTESKGPILSVEEPAQAPAQKDLKTDSLVDPISALIALRDTDPSDSDVEKLVCQVICDKIDKNAETQPYNVLFLYDPTTLARTDADRIYSAITSFSEKKPILLILNSDGGSVEAAYFIAKLCREYTSGRFVVVVPRRAKSAATLICCGADEIHMGSLSELGPIDPQFEDKPALALKNAIEHIAELAKRYPAASEMFSSYLTKSLKLEELGYYERVAESAAQYAERLLKKRSVTTDKPVSSIASRLVYDYKDHGFAIDANEASEIFGSEIVKSNTTLYNLANEIYETLDLIRFILKARLNRSFYFTGSAKSGCTSYKRK